MLIAGNFMVGNQVSKSGDYGSMERECLAVVDFAIEKFPARDA